MGLNEFGVGFCKNPTPGKRKTERREKTTNLM